MIDLIELKLQNQKFNEIEKQLNNKFDSFNPHEIVFDNCETIKKLVEEELDRLNVHYTYYTNSRTDLTEYYNESGTIHTKFNETFENFKTKKRKYSCILQYNIEECECFPLFVYMYIVKPLKSNKYVYDFIFCRSHMLDYRYYDPVYLKNYHIN